MPNCCQGASCACRITTTETGHMLVTGSGSANDPFILSADVALAVQDNVQFDMTLSGEGNAASPWIISNGYAPTARLANIPDVNATSPTQGEVLGWDDATSMWTATPPTTAPVGAVSTDGSLAGDGSAGTPLTVVPDASRLVQTSTAGVGLSNSGMAAVIQHFASAAARDAINPAPVLNQLTMLDDRPGRVDYWTGTVWAPVLDTISVVPTSPALLELSGPYNVLAPITHWLRNVSLTADGSGNVTLISSADLAGYAGVLDMHFQETGTVPIRVLATVVANQIRGTAYGLTDGTPAAGVTVTGMIRAYLY